MKHGPNFNRLLARMASVIAIPKGGGFADGLKALSSKENLTRIMREATKQTEAALRAVREAADPNPWKEADDEAIAGEILRQVKEKKNRDAVTPLKEGKP